MKVLVAGAGAVGQWLSALLVRSGHEVTAFTTARHAGPLRDLQVTGATTWRGAVAASTRPQGTYDAIVVAAKAHATRDVAAACAGHLAPGGWVASLQNGFGNGAKLRAAFPGAGVAVGVHSHGLTLARPGHVVHAGTGSVRVGPAPGPTTAADVAAGQGALALLQDAGLGPAWASGMAGHVWAKGLVNHAINPLAAVAGVANGALLEGDLRGRSQALAHEGWSLSRAAGVALPDAPSAQAAWEAVEATLQRTRGNLCSMLQDVQARRPTEAEQISGFLVRTARRLGYPLAVGEQAYRDVKALEASYLGEAASLALTRAEAEAWTGDP